MSLFSHLKVSVIFYDKKWNFVNNKQKRVLWKTISPATPEGYKYKTNNRKYNDARKLRDNLLVFLV